MKKILSYILILLFLPGNFSPYVFAQTASSSALEQQVSTKSADLSNLQGSTSSASSAFDNIFVDSSIAPSNAPSQPNLLPSVLPVFDAANTQPLSGIVSNINTKWTITPNLKHDYKGDEAYGVNIDNISPQDVSAQVFDANGSLVSVNFDKLATTNGTLISVLPPKNFRPGKYTLKISDASGNTQTQSFTWGVLAINTDKSIYLPNETANLSMAVLDDSGDMVCDANVTLIITDPSGTATTLSTTNGKIVINQQCRLHNFSLTPDYQAFYQVGGAGIYNMSLSAITQNGTRTVTDSFQVQNSVPFDVTRQTGTRIYPPDTYPVNLNIKVNQDFTGQIIDYVPNSFTISPSTNSAAPVFDVKDIATPIQNPNGTISSLQLSLPFSGSHTETLGFGEKLLDPQEKDLYSQFGLAGHDGLDFAMPIGTPVLAADNGTVVMAGGIIYGTTIVVQHSWGRSYYGHLSRVEVVLGQNVSKGQEIGLSGNTGITTGPHLHFGIKLSSNDPANGFYGKTDPSIYLGIQSKPLITASDINNTTKAIVWNVAVKKGDILNLSYNFRMPNVSPMFYTIGPLSFVANNNVVFQEVRQWQLAADAAKVIILTSGTSWNVPADFSFSNDSIEAIGGGGGGGGGLTGGNGPNSGGAGGGAGGGGEYRRITSFNPGAGPISYVIGSAGVGGASDTNGTAGGDSTWNGTSLVAKGGSLGNAGGAGGTGGTGGTGANGNFNGGTGGSGASGTNNNGFGGGGGGGSGGTTANGGGGTAGSGQNGSAGGAGGAASGGSSGTANGGAGGNGTVWTDTSSLATGGSGGGGGGGNGGTNPGVGTGGGLGGNYGGSGGGGGGGSRKNSGGSGGNGIGGVIVITYTSIANTTEFGYRWRNDDGNETSGTSLANQNTDITGVAINTNIRLRFLIYNSGGSAAGGQTFRLDYAPLSGTCSSSSFVAVPTSSGSDAFFATSTTNYTNGAASTNVTSGPAVITDPSGGSFLAGQLMSTGNTTSSINLAGGQFTEIEYNFQPNSNATADSTYCFRVSNAGASINTYSLYAQATIASNGPTLDELLRHGEWFNNGIRNSFTF